MKQIVFDFDIISNEKDFYKIAKRDLNLPDYFGNNLDALWDCLTGDIELPVSISFVNMKMPQLEQFEDLLNVMEEAQTELGEDKFDFKYFLKKDY